MSRIPARWLLLLVLLAMGASFLNHLRVRGILDAYLPDRFAGRRGKSAAGSSGTTPCTVCHGEVGDYHLRGPHRSLACEDCHGSGEGHVSGGEKTADMPALQSITRLCSQCHRELNARRQEAPKLNLESHLIEVGALFSDRVCFDCHQPHDPRP